MSVRPFSYLLPKLHDVYLSNFVLVEHVDIQKLSSVFILIQVVLI